MTSFYRCLGRDRLSSRSVRFEVRGPSQEAAITQACGMINWDRGGSEQQLVCKAVSLAQGAVGCRECERHPLVVSLHFDCKRWSCSITHALLSFAHAQKEPQLDVGSTHVRQQGVLFYEAGLPTAT